jgi:hypothetical protein
MSVRLSLAGVVRIVRCVARFKNYMWVTGTLEMERTRVVSKLESMYWKAYLEVTSAVGWMLAALELSDLMAGLEMIDRRLAGATVTSIDPVTPFLFVFQS